MAPDSPGIDGPINETGQVIATTLTYVAAAVALYLVVAMVAEIGYVKVLEVYNYQDQQPFEFLGYPLFLGFVNSMSALIAGLALWALVPLVRGRELWLLVAVPPLAFGLDAVGSGFLYLALRHGSEDPNMVLMHLAALTVVAGGVATVRLLAMLLPDGRRAADAHRDGTNGVSKDVLGTVSSTGSSRTAV